MFDVRPTPEFQVWLDGLRDETARKRIASRILRAEGGNLGDHKSVETSREGVSEMRVDHGPGYRLYFVRRGSVLVVLLCGGDKRSQDRDFKRAEDLARKYKEPP